MKRRINTAGTMLASLIGFVAMVALSCPAWAVCVSDDLGFAVAAVEAEFTPLTIKLVQGTYHVDGTVFDRNNPYVTFQGFSLLGGYTDATCTTRQIDPTNTILSISAASQGDYGLAADVIGDVTIEGIHFTGAHGGFDLQWSDYFHDVPASVHATVRRNIVSGGGSSIIGFAVSGSQAFSARIVNNLIHDNSASGTFGCALGLYGHQDSDATFDLINNTIVNNATSDGGVCMGIAGYGYNAGVLGGYNNILYGNGGRDLDIAVDTAAVLFNNVIGAQRTDGVVIAFGTLTGNPQLTTGFHPIEAPASPVINSGDNDVPGGLPSLDLGGGPRVVGTTVDRGAYESGIKDALIQVVKNTNNSGADSLRTAIASINANGSGIITFDIGTGCGPQVITLASELPALTHGGIINGYTQTDASANDLDTGDDATLCVILESGNSSVTHGLQVLSGAGDAAALSIKGLGFSGFSDAAIDLQGGSGHFVAGNHFGGSVGGHTLQPNGVDIRLGVFAHDATIGSDDVADRNIVGDATGSGVVLQAGTYNNQILNNYVGLGWNVGASNYTNRGNGARGIHLLGHDNTVSGNVIGDNVQAGILIDGGGATNNVVASNFIGTDGNGATLANGNAGIHFTGSTGDAPSGNSIRYNTIANNGDEGVLVSIGQGNKIRRNSIYSNALLGIDLAGEGVTPNDDDGGIQLNDYANRGQNFPVMTSAAGGYHSGRVGGTLTTTGGDYTVDIFASSSCDASGHGEGKTWLKGATVTVTVPQGIDQGIATFDISFTTIPLLPLLSGEAITATATDQAGDTSEFSACMSYLNDTIFADGFDPSLK
jgi:hypothetical protein